jgi:uncharacterized protein (TIGR03437 family)
MRSVSILVALLALTTVMLAADRAPAAAAYTPVEWQLTFSTINKALDNNDNWSRDDRFLVADTRETYGGGIGNGNSIMKVSVYSGLETIFYAPVFQLDTVSSKQAPGLGAASFSPLADEAIFIHGPFVDEAKASGVYYMMQNRRGGIAKADGSNEIRFADLRDVTSDVTTPGAHRGGTHRHEYTLEGNRIGFTYDDYLLRTYQRTIGYMEPVPNHPAGADCWTALLVRPVLTADQKPGDVVKASDDSWIGARGQFRGFIGAVVGADGKTITNSLFTVEIPETVDITTSNSGTKTVYPTPPTGMTIRRITSTAASGIVRGSHDAKWVGYRAAAPDGTTQVFIVNPKGSDTSADESMRPMQASFLPTGASGGQRWHPSGNSIAVQADSGVAAICVKQGPLFGTTTWLTPHGSAYSSMAPEALVWSRGGKMLAFNRRVPTYDAAGNLVKDFNKRDFRQIFLTNFPDNNNNGIVDAIEDGVIKNAAGYLAGTVAPDSWASVFGTHSDLAEKLLVASSTPLPTTLGGVKVDVTDSTGATVAAQIYFVSPDQVNFIVPAATAVGTAIVKVTTWKGGSYSIGVDIQAAAPGVFTANSTGKGVPAANAVRIAGGAQTTESIFTCTTTCTATPIDLGPETDDVILLLYGTGIRGAKAVTATIGGTKADVLGFAAQGQYAALDQVNVRIPRALAGKGDVNIVLNVDGVRANVATINVK